MANKALNEGMKIQDGYLIIVKKISPMRSKSDKSTVIASTRGRETFNHMGASVLDIILEGDSIQVNLNAYILDPAK